MNYGGVHEVDFKKLRQIMMGMYYDFSPRLNANEWQRNQLHQDCKTVPARAGKCVILSTFVTKQVRYVLVQ